MRLLKEDMLELQKKFPGACEFIESAEQRYAAYKRVKRISEKGGQAVSGDACREGWFLERLKKEGLPTPVPKKVPVPLESKEEGSKEEAEGKSLSSSKEKKKPAKKKK